MVLGKRQLLKHFKKACDKFIYVENLTSDIDVKSIDEDELLSVGNKVRCQQY